MKTFERPIKTGILSETEQALDSMQSAYRGEGMPNRPIEGWGAK